MSTPSPTRIEHIAALARMGPKMQEIIRYCAEQPAPSKHALANEVYSHGGNGPIDRCIERGLLERDPDHPASSDRGDGAIVITDEGREFAALLE